MKRSETAMQRFFLTVMLVISMVGLVKGQELTSERTATPEQKEILRIEHEKLRAFYEGLDKPSIAADWLEHNETDDLAMTNSDGSTLTKAQHVAVRRSGEHKSLFQDHYDYKVRIYNGNTAVVTYLAYGITTTRGKLSGYIKWATTDVFVKLDGEWHTVVHHESRIPTQ
jgi:hypothetical protein